MWQKAIWLLKIMCVLVGVDLFMSVVSTSWASPSVEALSCLTDKKGLLDVIAVFTQIVLAVVGIFYVVYTYRIMKQGEQNQKNAAIEQHVLKKQYLRSILPVLQVCAFDGNESAVNVEVRNLRPGTPALSLCAIAYVPGLGTFVERSNRAVGDEQVFIQMHKDKGDNFTHMVTGDFGIATYWYNMISQVDAGQRSHGEVAILYRDVDGNGYVTSFRIYERDGSLYYKEGSEQQAMTGEEDALKRLSPHDPNH